MASDFAVWRFLKLISMKYYTIFEDRGELSKFAIRNKQYLPKMQKQDHVWQYTLSS